MLMISPCRIFTNRNLSLLTSNLFQSSINTTHSLNITDGEWIINILLIIIFLLALLGNIAALLVMFGSRGPIRLTNNKYLVNLACADLLRASFMPFTIIARMKRNFMFGPIICRVLPIVQGLSVAVDVFTLVCISVERYIAICRPLLILKLQSLRFANFLNGCILLLIWTLALLTALPNIFMYNLCSLPKPGTFKCEKVKPLYFDEKVYMIALDAFYFMAPMLIMLVLYTMIICKMYKNNTAMKMRSFQNTYISKTHSSSSSPPLVHRSSSHQYDTSEQKLSHQSSNIDFHVHLPSQQSSSKSKSGLNDDEHHQIASSSSSWIKYANYNRKRTISNPLSRYSWKETKNRNFNRTNSNRSRCSSTNQGLCRMDRHRRKALKLLIVIILEFFICWTPLYIYHTFGTFDKNFYRSMPRIFVDIILLFSFVSLLSNPFTYYFMSKRYRAVLYAYFSCCYWNKDKQKYNKKNQEAKQIVKALRIHQQENSLEYKIKNNKTKLSSSPNHQILYYPKLRSNTVQ